MIGWVRRHLAYVGVAALLAVVGIAVLHSTPTLAATCGSVDTAIISGDLCDGLAQNDKEASSDSSKSPIVGVFMFVLNILTALVGIVAIGALVFAGVLYASASANAAQVTKAKEYIQNTVIGLVCYAIMMVGLSFLLPGGLVGPGGITLKNGIPAGGPISFIPVVTLGDKKATSNSDGSTTNSTNNPRTTFEMVIGSWNVYKYGKSSNAVDGVKTLVGETDILGLQEAKGDSSKIRAAVACSSCSNSMYPTSKSGPLKISVVWDKTKLSVISKGHFNGGYQPAYHLQREFVWIKFKSKVSGKVFYYINTHFPHRGYTKKSGDWYYTNSANGKAWQTHMEKLVAKIKTFQKDNLPIFVTGDFNFNYRADNCKQALTPCRALSKDLSVKSGWEWTKLGDMGSSKGTIHDSKAIIDYVFSWQRSNVTYQWAKTLHGGTGNGWSGSDHKPIGLRVTIGSQ